MTTTINALEIREAQRSEWAAVIALTLAAYEQYASVLPPGAWPPYAEGIRATLGSDSSAARVIALDGDELLGSALLIAPEELEQAGRAPQPYPEIRLVATAPSARRRGVATALVKACIERTRAAGYRAIGLHSTAYMADAIRIYERIGFVRAPEYDFETPAGVLVMGFRFDFSA